MKRTRTAVTVLIAVLVIVTVLSFLYGVPSGRRVRRESLRAFRLARNFSGISPVPVLTLRVWNSARHLAVLVEVYDSGRVVAFRRGARIERTLPPQGTAEILEDGGEALGAFNTGDCGTTPNADGFNAELYLLIDGRRIGSLCRDAAKWPDSVEARRLFSAIERHLSLGVFPPSP